MARETTDIVEVVQLIKPERLPRGVFNGVWYGYEVNFTTEEGQSFRLRMKKGIRGRANCVITVVGEVLRVEIPRKQSS